MGLDLGVEVVLATGLPVLDALVDLAVALEESAVGAGGWSGSGIAAVQAHDVYSGLSPGRRDRLVGEVVGDLADGVKLCRRARSDAVVGAGSVAVRG